MATTVHSPAVEISDAEYVLAQLRELRQVRRASTERHTNAVSKLEESRRQEIPDAK